MIIRARCFGDWWSRGAEFGSAGGVWTAGTDGDTCTMRTYTLGRVVGFLHGSEALRAEGLAGRWARRARW